MSKLNTSLNTNLNTNNDHFGLIFDKPSLEHWIFGQSPIAYEELQPDGNWENFLPTKELQSREGLESYACVVYTILNCCEILIKRKYGLDINFAERFLAKILETGENRGSSPQVACEMLRQFGVPPESVYPFDEAVRTTDVYFKELYPELYEIAKEFNEEWDFKHDFVPTNSQDITQALKTSPLMISVYAWTQNEKGLYYRPTGVNDTHATTLFYERQDDFRRVFDSYADISDSVIKDYDWNSMPIIVKRFWIEKKVIEEYSSIGSVLIAWIKKIIKWLTQ